MTADLLAQAIALAQSGKKVEALPLLQQVLIADPLNETAWLWLADCLPDFERRIQALEVFTRAVPGAELAQATLNDLQQMQAAAQAGGARLSDNESPADAESAVSVGELAEVLISQPGEGGMPSFDGEYGELDIDDLREANQNRAAPVPKPASRWLDAARLALFTLINLLLLLGAALMVYLFVLRH